MTPLCYSKVKRANISGMTTIVTGKNNSIVNVHLFWVRVLHPRGTDLVPFSITNMILSGTNEELLFEKWAICSNSMHSRFAEHPEYSNE